MQHSVQTEHAITLVQNLYKCSEENKNTDFKIKGGGITFHCHKAVLCSNTTFFDSICSAGHHKAILDQSIIRKSDGRILCGIIKFMYLGSTDMTMDNVPLLLSAADRIKIPSLVSACEEYLISNVNISNLQLCEEIASKFGLDNLKEKCRAVRILNFSQMIKTSWFTSLQVDEVVQYLSEDELQVVNEDEVLEGVSEWLQKSKEDDDKKKVEYVEKIFPLIQLQDCSYNGLEKLMKQNDVFPHLKLKLYEYLRHGYGPEHSPRRKPKQPERSSESGEFLATDHCEEKIVLCGGNKSWRYPNLGNNGDFLYLDKYDGKLTHVTECAEMSQYSICADHNSIIVSGGIVRRNGNDIVTCRVREFSLQNKQWSNLPDLLFPRYGHASVCVGSKAFFLAGKENEEKFVKTVYILERNDKSWWQGNSITDCCGAVGAAVVKSSIIVCERRAKRICKYNITTDTWTKCKDMPQLYSFAFTSNVVVDDKLYFLSGEDSVLYSYNVPDDTWSVLTAPLITAMDSTMVLYGGKLVVLGGCQERYKEPHDFVQIYDLASKTWHVEGTRMPLPLQTHYAFVFNIPKNSLH